MNEIDEEIDKFVVNMKEIDNLKKELIILKNEYAKNNDNIIKLLSETKNIDEIKNNIIIQCNNQKIINETSIKKLEENKIQTISELTSFLDTKNILIIKQINELEENINNLNKKVNEIEIKKKKFYIILMIILFLILLTNILKFII